MSETLAREGKATARQQIYFDSTSEVFATDANGQFHFPLLSQEQADLDTSPFDELRFLVSIWHPATSRTIDLDRAYVEFRLGLWPQEDHWVKLAEIEPVVPPIGSGDRFDGWIILPIFSPSSVFSVYGSGFDPRARLQIRAAAYLVG